MRCGSGNVLETELAVGGGIGVPRGNGLEEVPQPRPGREIWCQRHGLLCVSRGGVERLGGGKGLVVDVVQIVAQLAGRHQIR